MLRLICAFLFLFSTGAPLQHSKLTQAAPEEGDSSAAKQARELLAAHRLDAASDVLNKYLANHPKDATALTLLAEVRIEAGEVAEGKRLLALVLQAEPNQREANMTAGKLLLSEQRYPEAMDRFETVLNALPKDTEARHFELEAVTRLAASAAQAGKPEAALAALEHARSKMPDDSRLLMDVGLQEIDLHLFAEAQESLGEARRLAPNDPDVIYAEARLELEEQHMLQAEANLRSYLAIRPNDASAHFGLGRVLAMDQRDDEAMKEFVRSTELQPLQTESYYQIGQLDLNAHRNEAALPMFQRVIARDAKHGGALVGLGQIAFQAKRYDEAETYLRKAVEVSPEYGLGHYYLGLTLARLGKKDEAEQELKKATDLGKAAAAPIHGAAQAEPH